MDSVGRVVAANVVNPKLHVVVWQADPVIWIDAAMLEELKRPDRKRKPGDAEIDGDLISFGSAGEGLGRVTYRIAPRTEGRDYHVAERIDT